METTSFDDILKDEKPEEVKEVEVETEAPPQTEEVLEKPMSPRKRHQAKEFEAQGRDPETGQFIKEEEKEEKEEKTEVKTEKVETKVEPKVELSDKEKAFLRTAEEERHKRQELERRLAVLEAKPKEETKEGEKKTFWDDPEGHLKTHEERISSREKALLLNISERLARSKYSDFDEKIAVFAESLKTPAGPGIHAQFMAAPDPAEFAYNLGKHTKEVKDAGSIDALREKIAKEERQKLEAEFKKKQEDLEKQRKDLPGSLSDVKGASRKSVPVWTGPPSFEEILKP